MNCSYEPILLVQGRFMHYLYNQIEYTSSAFIRDYILNI